MAKARYDVFETDYLAIRFECPKCGNENDIYGVEIPIVEEKLHLSHHCQQKKCAAKYSIDIIDHIDYGEVYIPELSNDDLLKVESIMYEYYSGMDLSLLHYIDNAVEIKEILGAVKNLEVKIRKAIYKLLYVKLISMMDYFLSSMVRKEMAHSDEYKQKYATYKLSSNEVNFNKFYREHIAKEHFQNIENVAKLLSNVFDIKIDIDQYSLLQDAVHKRNAIVHKNSFEDKNKGKFYDISEDDIFTLKSEIDRLTQEVRENFDEQWAEKMVFNNNKNNEL